MYSGGPDIGSGGGLDSTQAMSLEKKITLEHAGYDYGGYKEKGGLLDLKIYKEALRRAREYRRSHNAFAGSQEGDGGGGEDSFSDVQSMLQHAKIHEPGGKPLTVRNQPQVFVYQALKDILSERPDLKKIHAARGWKETNQQYLAEALRILGDKNSLTQFREKSVDKDFT
jgi:hypothetical protein